MLIHPPKDSLDHHTPRNLLGAVVAILILDHALRARLVRSEHLGLQESSTGPQLALNPSHCYRIIVPLQAHWCSREAAQLGPSL